MRRRLDRTDMEDPEDPRSIAMTNRETRPGESLCGAKRPHRALSFFLLLQTPHSFKNLVRACSQTKFIVPDLIKPSAHGISESLYNLGTAETGP